MAVRRMRRIERELRARYFEGACAIVEEFGGRWKGTENGASGPHAEYVLMTDAGPLMVVVYDDWTHTCFEDPKAGAALVGNGFGAADPMRGCNPFSGKWNFHTFLGQQKAPTARYVDECLRTLRAGMEKAEARAMTEDEIAAYEAAEAIKDARRQAEWAAAMTQQAA